MFRPFVLAGALVALSIHAAAAQQPTQTQRDAIRASCRSDFIANCSGVTPGGREAVECLLRNQAKLSPACNTAVSAIVPAKPVPVSAPAAAEAPAAPISAPAASSPAPAKSEQAPPQPAAATAPKSAGTQEAQLKSVRQSCTLADFMAHCSWIKPDNPELLLCLQANASDLSQPCQAAVQATVQNSPVQSSPPPAAETPPAAPERKATTKSKKSTASREPAPTPPPPAVASAPPAAAPTEAQKSAIRAACRSDFMANCSGVQPGGVEALQCLKSHAAKLSGACQSAVAAIGGGAPPSSSSASSATMAPAASGPAPALAPLGPIPPMRPREALGILAMCRAEHETLCADVPLGGGRILNCLADHAQQLSLQCYEALSRATQ